MDIGFVPHPHEWPKRARTGTTERVPPLARPFSSVQAPAAPHNGGDDRCLALLRLTLL